ncbi:hypothetical protein CC1G_12213 [Coprinopsis cinerea okayama7|uniref:Uncharacterized protein n=1 Tax=Coprinopsis cinerea (strain Okayama-7 / 130 / ATCC MYA-4618 / FGSC 9003) TaxID=240176 RepID=A8NKR0_COPC7|nr:hypothetical protein CC1G_12213 [Coprinopsis cinerea okayama7\|eukprot:XP_001834524.2 hypothetical protein CC1G_12213 [Coprinopsis cinerea okayama7\
MSQTSRPSRESDKENAPPNPNASAIQSRTTRAPRRAHSEIDCSGDEGDHGDGPRESAFGLGPRKRACRTDPLVHHGRHFGRTIQAFCRVQTLIKNGMTRSFEMQVEGITEADLSDPMERREHGIYKALLNLSPGLEERLCTGSDEDIFHVAEMIQKGSSSARADDTKGLKTVIIDWITPPGQCLNPPLARNVKTDRGFYHEATGRLLCPIDEDWNDQETRELLRSGVKTVSGDQWPLLLFKDYKYNPDNIWDGLFRSQLLVNAFKHIFTSPSSVDREPRATRSGNARIHGMTSVTIGSLAYVATQVRFALSSSPVFSRTDLQTDSERFYESIMEAFHDPVYEVQVKALLEWWNKQIFPAQVGGSRPLKKGSVLARMKEQAGHPHRNRQVLGASNSQTSSSTSASTAAVADSNTPPTFGSTAQPTTSTTSQTTGPTT